jgi:hypothetical protein
MPSLDIEQISPIGDLLFTIKKTMDTVTDDLWGFTIKATIIPFSIFTSAIQEI